MDRNVMLTISGLHSGEADDNGSVETKVRAEYFKRNESHYLLYEEKEEGFGQTSQNRIKFRGNMLELTRQGLLNTHMVFEENKRHMTPYQTPYGQMLLEIHTKKVDMQEQENCIRVVVEYTLEADEAYLSDSRIEICIEPV